MTILSVMSIPINAKRFYDNKTAVLFCGESTSKYEKNTVYIAKKLENDQYEWKKAEFNVIQTSALKPASKSLCLDENVFLYIGETTDEFKKDCFYRCVAVEQNGAIIYKWQQVEISDNDNQYMSLEELYQYWEIED